MALNFDFIDDITPLKEDWRIKVRISTLWNTTKYNNFNEVNSIDMLLLDEKHGKIQAAVKKTLIDKYKAQLDEGRVYIITNFAVGENSGIYRSTHHPYKINFNHSTSVKVCDDPTLPSHSFHFISIGDIASGQIGEKNLVDVIGELTSIGQLTEYDKNGKKSQRLAFNVEDEEKRKLNCVVWDNLAVQMSKDVEAKRHGRIITVLHLARIKEWNGMISLTNSYLATRIFVDSNIREIFDYKNRLQLGDDGSTTISHISVQPSYSIKEDFLKLSEKKSIDEIRETCQISTCVTLATIVKIETDYNWFFNSCKKCKRKVNPDGGKFWCDNCCEYSNVIMQRYKIQVRVIDNTGSTSFEIFDREALEFLHKSAAELREQVTNDGDTDSIPKELDEFLNKKFIFKVQISKFNLEQNWPVYTVMRMTNDQSLIDSFMANSNDASSNYEQKNIEREDDEVHFLDNERNSMCGSTSSITTHGKNIKGKDLHQYSSEEDIPAQLSTNKKKKIKIEPQEE